MQHSEPPEGWVWFGTHADEDACPYRGPLAWLGTGEDGLPEFERHDNCSLIHVKESTGMATWDFSIIATCEDDAAAEALAVKLAEVTSEYGGAVSLKRIEDAE